MKLPDGPKASNFVQLIQWISDPLRYMDECSKQYGDMVTVNWGNYGSIVMVNHPQVMQELFTNDQFEAPGKINGIFKPLVGEQSMFLMERDRHKRQRQLLMPSFHGERMKTYGDQICAISHDVINQLSIAQPFIARSIMQKITLRVIMHAVFGLDRGDRFEALQPMLSSLLGMVDSPLRASILFFPSLQKDLGPWSPWGRFQQKRRKIDELIFAEIADRRAKPDEKRTDILSLMMEARDENGESMTDIELHDELLTLLFAGHETTATALAWAFYWIHKYPSVREKLLQELDNLGENPDPMTIFRLPYLSAVCQETLRIYPVGMLTFPRVTKSAINLMGHEFAPGTTLVGSIYLTHRREELYPNPLEFRPERFLERQFSPYEYLPFGGGARRCLGLALAQFEMKLVLAMLLQNYQFELGESQVKPKRRGVTLGPSGGVKMIMKGRRTPQQIPEKVASLV
ncbi:MAG: hypothetical protein RLZZ338_1553 [Cyanobacteriota bacterium]|jgi:cytochrome P450